MRVSIHWLQLANIAIHDCCMKGKNCMHNEEWSCLEICPRGLFQDFNSNFRPVQPTSNLIMNKNGRKANLHGETPTNLIAGM